MVVVRRETRAGFWQSNKRTFQQLLALAVLGIVGLPGTSCASHAECTPPIPSGVTYRVRVAPVLPQGQAPGCHVIDLTKSITPNQFEITTGRATPTPSRPDCSLTPLQ